uniref:Uncharacterized protein n=1 Tax=Siphoviridae sp. ct3R43 TaxID=2825321 RepID=A0A8S5VGB1_9CAUD|nr:MAG TPA: hypothetical protein [Siphoviridae sp. ct3R43]
MRLFSGMCDNRNVGELSRLNGLLIKASDQALRGQR